MADLATIKDGWDAAAREDAMFNIVTLPQYAGGRWPVDEFFEHGRAEIDALMVHLERLGVRKGNRRALDFGCGVGRLTQALADYYGRVIGADISAEMVRQAEGLNRHGDRVVYVNSGASLGDTVTGKFDLIYSRITLQHMPSELQKGYVGEFVKLLAPKGLAVFQIPDGPEYHHPNEWLSMYGVARATVQEWVRDLGAQLVDVELLEDASPTWLAYRYTVTP